MPPHPAPWGLGLEPPASRPLHQDNTHHLCSPSWATWAEEAETKKGEEGDPRVGVSLFFPAPTGWRVGVGWDRRDRGRERERERERDNQGRVTQRETRRATDSQIQKPRERKSVLRRGERHIKCRRQVGKLSEGEISARKDLVERGAEMPRPHLLRSRGSYSLQGPSHNLPYQSTTLVSFPNDGMEHVCRLRYALGALVRVTHFM